MNDIVSQRQLSEKALKVWNRLGAKQRELIRKDCPFRMDRNSVLRNLRMRGVSLKVLAELSGLSKDYLCCLMAFKHGRPMYELGNLKVDIGRLRGKIAALAARVAGIEEGRPKLREASQKKRQRKEGIEMTLREDARFVKSHFSPGGTEKGGGNSDYANPSGSTGNMGFVIQTNE